jgi:hypothetical protein
MAHSYEIELTQIEKDAINKRLLRRKAIRDKLGLSEDEFQDLSWLIRNDKYNTGSNLKLR